MNKKRLQYLLLLVFFGAINIYIFVNRNNGFKYFPFKTYSELYVTDSSFYIKNMQFVKDSLHIIFSKKLSSSKYFLSVDSLHDATTISTNQNEITIPLLQNFHHYFINCSGTQAKEIQLNIDHSNSANEFIYSNIPGPQISVSSYNTWFKKKEIFTNTEYKTGDSLLRKYTHVFDANTDSAKVLEIAKFISLLHSNPKGISSEVVASKNALQQIDLALENKAELLCGNYTSIFYFLCTVAGIPCRVITYRGPAGNWQYGVHYYNEVYLHNKEQWALVDATNNIYLPHDSSQFYNAADVKKMVQVNGFLNKSAFSFVKDSLSNVPYNSINAKHIYYNSSNANICFIHPGADLKESWWANFIDFYSFNRDYDFYSDVNSNNWFKIMIKETFFFLNVLLLIAYLFFEIKTKLKN